MNELFAAIVQFFQDGRTQALLALIGIDLVLGIAAAFRTRTFDPRRLADFYSTMVIPYIGGYLVLYVAGVLALERLPAVGPLLDQIAQWAGPALAVLNLVGSILSNVQEIRSGLPAVPPAPDPGAARDLGGSGSTLAPVAGVDLSEAALKAVRNNVISALTHSTDWHAAFATWLAEAGVLTTGNLGGAFAADGHIYQRLSDVGYEQLRKFLDPKPPHAP